VKGARETGHIVILNDNEDLLFLLQQLFQDEGYRVTVTTREERALRVLSREPCDLFIQDLNRMDGAGGFALLELMRRSACFCDIPVVIASTEPLFQAQQTALAALDVIDAIVLPSDHHTLIERVRRAIGRQG
jgi:DNA-binding NtrC family response regulator